MTYQQAISHLNSFINFERLPELNYNTRDKDIDDFRNLLDLLGNPHFDYPTIHIAGTKGKGSTAAMLASVFQAAGYKVGLYTSPHLISVRERIRINGRMVSKQEFTLYIKQISDTLTKSDVNLRTAYRTVFEHLTAAAMLHFSRKKVDVAIFEAGLGGKLDSTIVLNPILSILTPIGLDHTAILGETISEITSDKAHIIKQSTPVVSSQQTPEAKSQIVKRSKSALSSLSFAPGRDEFEVIESNYKYQLVRTSRNWLNSSAIRINLAGQFQLDNLSTVLDSIEILRKSGFNINRQAILRGLLKVRWAGRLQYIKSKPPIILDGSHNELALGVLIDAVMKLNGFKGISVIFSAIRGKPAIQMLKMLSKISETIFLVPLSFPKALPLEELFSIAQSEGITCQKCNDINAAIDQAKNRADPNNTILITGSLYLVGEVLRYLRKIPPPPIDGRIDDRL
ncbi:bifunctional folylpolyglutamate synthase/dihydrofolate synthase [bacterium]|nr:bifunctional folylpolyglutamate synthase/dihydrofolate synthase [bacterium]